MLSLATILLPVCLAANSPDPRSESFPTGHLTEYVQSESNPAQQFALYLPTGFDPARPTPIIYLMDPRSRARVPAKLFQEAAERFGYILVSSHLTSSDGPMEPNLRAIQAMWDDTHTWFAIDPLRTYIAGFSGTARTASLLAQNRPAFTGVIGAAAGFHPDVKPSRAMNFLYYGAVGDVDYNYHDLEEVEHAMAALDLPHRLERFPGPHSWMPPDVAMRAVEWLELRAMQAGSRPVDSALVDAWWARDDALARDLMDAGRVLDAARQYAAMARDFKGLRDIDAVRQAAARIGSSPAAKAQLKKRQAETRQSNEWVANGMQAIADAFPEGEPAPMMPVQDLVQALDLPRMKRTVAGEAPEVSREAQRRLNQLEVQLGFYLPQDALAHAELKRAAYYLTVALELDAASPVTWYLTAQTHARLNAPRRAVAALERAIDAGFRDLRLLAADGSFRRLHDSPDYHAIVDRLRTEGDGLDWLTVDRPPVSVLK